MFNHKETDDDSKLFKVYEPSRGDALHEPDTGYIPYKEDGRLVVDEACTKETRVWWNMACGRVLGMLIEDDPSTLAPLGLVVGADELGGKRVAVIDSGLEECVITTDENGMEGADCGGDVGR